MGGSLNNIYKGFGVCLRQGFLPGLQVLDFVLGRPVEVFIDKLTHNFTRVHFFLHSFALISLLFLLLIGQFLLSDYLVIFFELNQAANARWGLRLVVIFLMLLETVNAEHLETGIIGAEVAQWSGCVFGTRLINALFALAQGKSTGIHEDLWYNDSVLHSDRSRYQSKPLSTLRQSKSLVGGGFSLRNQCYSQCFILIDIGDTGLLWSISQCIQYFFQFSESQISLEVEHSHSLHLTHESYHSLRITRNQRRRFELFLCLTRYLGDLLLGTQSVPHDNSPEVLIALKSLLQS